MAKATSSRKTARVKRKGTSAAKRAAARKPVARARKITTAKTARLRRTARPSARRPQGPAQPGTGDALQAAAAEGPSEITKTPVREPERVPPPLPVPIASFTF
jgi:hypothetical protein